MKKNCFILLNLLSLSLFSLVLLNPFGNAKPAYAAYSPSNTYSITDPIEYYSSIDSSLNGLSLLEDLQDLNTTRRKKTIGYSSMGTSASSSAYVYTDYDPAYVNYDSQGMPFGSKILSFYSGTSTTSWNREHVWPNTHGGGEKGSLGSGPYVDADIHVTRPTISSENSDRGHSHYVTGYNHSSNGWDPVEAFANTIGVYPNIRGECARIIFYCMVADNRLELVDITDSGTRNNKMGKLSDLLMWSLENPVNQREINRNNGAQYLQGNRNPFIDHPEYACKIWGNTNSSTKEICRATDVSPTSLTISPTNPTLAVGEVINLSVNANSGASNSVTWVSSDSSIASIDSNGTLSAISMGSVTIKAISNLDENIFDTITVNVKDISFISHSGSLLKSDYYSNEVFSSEGLVFTIHWSDETTSLLDASKIIWPSLSVGMNEIVGLFRDIEIIVSGIEVNAPITPSGNDYYEKVETTREDWAGEYLIVNETDSVFLKGSLPYSSVNSNNNSESVSIVDNKILYDSSLHNNSFIISPFLTSYSIKSTLNDYYLCGPSKGLCTDTESEINLSISNGDVSLGSLSSFLFYNSQSGVKRFRFYGSSSGQIIPIQLYRLVKSSPSSIEHKANLFAIQFNESAICGNDIHTKASSTKWLEQKNAFNLLDEETKAYLRNVDLLSNEYSIDISECITRYDRIISLYSDDSPLEFPNFMSRYIVFSRELKKNNPQDINLLLGIIIASTISLCIIPIVFKLKKTR